MTSATVTDADLHALVDDQLSRERLDVVRHRLAADPEASAQVDRWIAGRDALRASLAAVATEPVPLRLTLERIEPSLAQDRDARRRILFALGFLAGFAAGLLVAAGLIFFPQAALVAF